MKKVAHNRVDLTGQVFGSWTVTDYSHTNDKIIHWHAVCNGPFCGGTQHIVRGQNLRNGLSTQCKKCGLKANAIHRTGKKRTKKTAHEMRVNYLYIVKKKSATKRGIEWGLTVPQFESIIFQNCHYSGLPPSTTTNVLVHSGLKPLWEAEGWVTYNGLDRIDSSKGYVMGNVVPANSKVNCAKNDDTTEDFLAWVKAIAVHQGWVEKG